MLTFVLLALLADWLPLPVGVNQLDLERVYQPPGTARHLLGTDQLGRDLLTNLLYGCRTALLVSVPAMLLAVMIGLLLGGVAGYYGDRSLRIGLASALMGMAAIVLAYFYGFYIRQPALADGASTGKLAYAWEITVSIGTVLIVVSLSWFISRFINRWFPKQPGIQLPVDGTVLKLIELVSSVPRIVLILGLAAYVKPSLLALVCLTGLTYWTEPARLIRAELLRIRNMPYIETARALGLKDVYILVRHALPNALPAIVVAFAFGVGSLMTIESTLSFLGVGVPDDVPSWGKIIAGARTNLQAWWLIVFPGGLLSSTVLALQTIAGYFIWRLNPRNK